MTPGDRAKAHSTQNSKGHAQTRIYLFMYTRKHTHAPPPHNLLFISLARSHTLERSGAPGVGIHSAAPSWLSAAAPHVAYRRGNANVHAGAHRRLETDTSTYTSPRTRRQGPNRPMVNINVCV